MFLRASVVIFAFCFPLAAIAEEPKQLTTDGMLKMDPVYMPGGREVAYSVQQDSRLMTLAKFDVASGEVTRLHPQSTRPEMKPGFAREGKTFVYLRSDGNQDLDVYQGELGTEDAKKLGDGRGPCLTPDGKRIVYSKVVGDTQQLVSIAVGGGDEKKLTDFNEPNVYSNWPHVSQDGQHVVFATSRHDGDLEIYRTKIDGSAPQRLTEARGRDFRPAWSPDGKRIVFVSQRSGNLDLWLMNADGSGLKQLTTNEESDDYPAWHPDGKQLVYVREHDGRMDLFVLLLEKTP